MGYDLIASLRRTIGAVRQFDVASAAQGLRSALRRTPAPAAKPAPAAPKRKRLGAVVADLAAQRLPASAPLPRPELPDLAARSFDCAAGRRDYRLFVPPGKPSGLILMLHGCLQTPEDFALGTGINALAAEHGIVVAWPEQTHGDNARSCWNWFDPEHQHRGAGEPAILASLAKELRAEFRVPRARTFVAGLSAGGSMAAVLGEAYPEAFAAVGVHSGLACGTAHDGRSALAAMRGAPAAARPLMPANRAPRVIVFQGTTDHVVHPMNADRVMARACALADVRPSRESHAPIGERTVGRSVARRPDGTAAVELWMIEGTGHAWSGGNRDGSFTDAAGPDASAEMLRFFLEAA